MKWAVIFTSCVGHIAAVMGLDQIEGAPAAPLVVPIVFEEAPELLPEPAPPEPSPPDSTPQVEDRAPPKSASPSTTPVAASPAPSPAPAPTSLDSVQDLGLELGGTSGGLAVAAGTGVRGAPQQAPATRRILGATPQPASQQASSCADDVAKPRLRHLPQPAYTDSARLADISGKVRISITVSASGQVVQASVLQSLGHGLDESALAAARAATFEPAIRCGKPSTSTFTFSVRFSAS